MRVWRNSPRDAWLVLIGLGQLGLEFWSALAWPQAGVELRLGMLAMLVAAKVYAVVVVAHLFTHAPWFRSARLNAAAGVLNSLNIGQSVMAYRLAHVHNHHRFNNDRQGPDGKTRDLSSTFAGSRDGDHVGLLRYALGGAVVTLIAEAGNRLAAMRLWRGEPGDDQLLALLSTQSSLRARALRQIQSERAALALTLIAALAFRPQWVLLAYLPATVLAFALVNVQNYYEHYGALPEDRFANSASHYGRVYNLLTFNDGYHQEHHLKPASHWSALPQVRLRHCADLGARERIISPLPAVLGFLDVRRRRLDRARAHPPGPPCGPARPNVSIGE